MVTATTEAQERPEIKYWLNYGDRIVYAYTRHSDTKKKDVTSIVPAMVTDRITQEERNNPQRQVSLNLELPVGGLDHIIMSYQGKVENVVRIVSRN